MMTTQKIIRSIQNNSAELAHLGTEMLENVYKTSVTHLHKVKDESQAFMSTIYDNHNPHWVETRQTIDKYVKANKTKIDKFSNEARTTLEDYRDRIFKELSISREQYQNLLDTVEMHLYSLPIPFVKQVLFPIHDYDRSTVKEIMPQLAKLDKKQLAFLLKYEEKNLNRVTLIREFNRLLNQN